MLILLTNIFNWIVYLKNKMAYEPVVGQQDQQRHSE